MEEYAISQALAEAVRRVQASIATVVGARRPASALAFSADLLLTAAHVLGRRDRGQVVLPNGDETEALVVGKDAASDVAILRLTRAQIDVPNYSDGERLAVGHLALAVARPERDLEATFGVVRRLGGPFRSASGAEIDRHIDVDASLPEGFSGGALIDEHGQVLGMNTHGVLRSGATIPTQTLRRIAEQLLERGSLRPGYLGVGVQAVRLPARVAAQVGRPVGALVTSIAEDAPADRAGLMLGDLLLALDDQPLACLEDLQSALHGKADLTISIRALRGGNEMIFPATLVERPGPGT